MARSNIKADLEQMRWIKKHLPYLTYVKFEESDGKHKFISEMKLSSCFDY